MEEVASVKSTVSVKDPDLVENEGKLFRFVRITK